MELTEDEQAKEDSGADGGCAGQGGGKLELAVELTGQGGADSGADG